MANQKELHTLPVDVPDLKHHDWVHLECRKHKGKTHEGIFLAGGSVVGLAHVPDVYYKQRYGAQVVTLIDPVLNDQPFNVLVEDIEFLEVLAPSVPND